MLDKTGSPLKATIALNETVNESEIFIICAAVFSILFGLYNAWWILRIEIVNKEEEMMQLRDDKQMKKMKEMQNIADLIANGAQVFLKQEYFFVSIIVVLFSIVIAFTVEK